MPEEAIRVRHFEREERRVRAMLNPHIARIIGWMCVLAILALSLAPGSDRPHTGYSGGTEHIFAYAGTGFFFSLGYRPLRERLTIWISLALLSGLLELAQTQIPGRSARLIDAIVSTTGLTTGFIIGSVFLVAIAKRSFGDNA